MRPRAEPSGNTLTNNDAAIIKAMLLRGDRQHDIAAWFGVNGGRIGEISTGEKFGKILPSEIETLPPPVRLPTVKQYLAALEAVAEAKLALESAMQAVSYAEKKLRG